MSYMRGEHYVWNSGDHMHIWVNTDADEIEDPTKGAVMIPNRIFDMLVMMRHAEMTEKERAAVGKAAVKKYGGNIGCFALEVMLGGDPTKRWGKARHRKKG